MHVVKSHRHKRDLGDRVTVTTCICISYKYLRRSPTLHTSHHERLGSKWGGAPGSVWPPRDRPPGHPGGLLARDGLPLANIHPLRPLLLHCEVRRLPDSEGKHSIDIFRFAGISFMKDRAAYECRTAMFIYNVFQTFFSLWIFSRFGGFWLTGKYNWKCQPVDYSNSEDGLK